MADTNISRRMAFPSFRQVFLTGSGNTVDSFRHIWLHRYGFPAGAAGKSLHGVMTDDLVELVAITHFTANIFPTSRLHFTEYDNRIV
jgi:hypothetical protein